MAATLSVTTCLISHSLHFWCHERCGARASWGRLWLVGEILPHVHTSDDCLGLHKDLLPVSGREKQRGHLWETVWMKTGGLAAEVWAPETAQVLTLKVSQVPPRVCTPCSGTTSAAQCPPHTKAPLWLQKPGAAPHLPLALGLTGVPSGGLHSRAMAGATKRGPVSPTSMWRPLWLLSLWLTPGCREPWGQGSHHGLTIPTQQALAARAGGPRPGSCLCPLGLPLVLLSQLHCRPLPCCHVALASWGLA